MKRLLIGADPEMFASKGGIIDSVAGKLGCSKKNKLSFEGFRIQEDNVLIEFDIDPNDTFSGFNADCSVAMMKSKALLLPLGMNIEKGSSHVYTREELMSFHKSAFEFGCDPDYNILDGRRNPKPVAQQGLRTAGGHLHIGWSHIDDSNMKQTQQRVGTMCDYLLGIASVIKDSDTRRRELYGKAGAVRTKEYGIEYRSLSNFWIWKKEDRRWAYDTAIKAYNAANGEQYDKFLKIISHRDVQHIINTGDVGSANQLIGEFT